MKKVLLSLLVAISLPAYAQPLSATWLQENYDKQEVMIPMRDSISLYTAIYLPKDGQDAETPALQETSGGQKGHPIIMMRTPYSCKPYGKDRYTWKKELKNYYLHHYIIVLQDVRGRYQSEGTFVNLEEKPSDTYDTAEWLVKHIPGNNGRIGVTGTSYPGYYATMAAVCGHPAIQAVAPQAPILDWFMGDDAHHHGVLMLLDTYFFGRSFYRPSQNPTTSLPPIVNTVDRPVYQFFLDHLTFDRISATFPEPLEFWNLMAEHPNYDDYWKAKTPQPLLKDLQPAIMIVGGSYDTDDCYGALQTYRTIQKNSPATEVHLVYGPWYHGSWRNSDRYLDEIEYPFFRYHLEQKGQNLPAVLVFPSRHSRGNDPEPVRKAGEPLCLTADSWSREEFLEERYFLHSGQRLSTSAPDCKPSSAEGHSTYRHDPMHPVPHYHDSKQMKKDRRYMIADQRAVSCRNDVLSFSTCPLADTLQLYGPVDVELFTSSSTEDADYIVKVIDVSPDGYQMLVRWEVLRARYRKSFEHPSPMRKGKVEKIRFSMSDIAHHFLPGHCLMVQIQSSFFPALDLNPGTYVNIYHAQPEDYVPSIIQIEHNRKHASNITFHRMKGVFHPTHLPQRK